LADEKRQEKEREASIDAAFAEKARMIEPNSPKDDSSRLGR